MKKFAMAAVAAAALSAGVAQAYTVGTFSNGFVVPNVIHNGTQQATAVGLINQSGGTRAVYWVFFDQDSQHIADGCFTLTNKDYEPFVWNPDTAGNGLEGKRGYLVFSVGADSGGAVQTSCGAAATLADPADAQISANAFYVDVAAQDVAVVPVIDGPLTIRAGDDLTTLGPDSLQAVAGAAQVAGGVGNANFSLRYAIGGSDTTNIVVWSTGDQKGTHTVNVYDDKQNRRSANFTLAHTELDWFDPKTIAGLPASYVDGFIDWNANVALTTASIFTYSVISAPAFGAVQTVLGAHR